MQTQHFLSYMEVVLFNLLYVIYMKSTLNSEQNTKLYCQLNTQLHYHPHFHFT